METTQQLDLWRSEFGRDYTNRNDHEKPERVDAWRRLLEGIAPGRVVEVGCNVGWNLEYLRRLCVRELFGVEPQAYAVARAQRQRATPIVVVQGTAFDLPFRDGWADLVFTSGVLIHISPEEVGKALDQIYRVSRRWIVAIEYDHPVETEVHYRGHDGALWKRDHGALWRERYPDLREVRTLKLDTSDGYDDCTAHLFEKAGK
jgi:pseudaminic acid biosynthesis-associated methylase